jgi:hypothetical protein
MSLVISKKMPKVNWKQTDYVVYNALRFLDERNLRRPTILQFLRWYDTMRNSQFEIGSPTITNWLLQGRASIRAICVILYNVNKALLHEFIGCRNALTTWLIGLYEAAFLLEANSIKKEQLRSFYVDMKAYCYK